MSTDNPRPFAGMSVQAVAEATGLSRATIYQAAEHARLGAPAHFTYSHSITVYTPLGLCRLIEALDELQHTVASRALAEVVGRKRQEAATVAGVTSPDTARREFRRWDLEHERHQEDAA